MISIKKISLKVLLKLGLFILAFSFFSIISQAKASAQYMACQQSQFPYGACGRVVNTLGTGLGGVYVSYTGQWYNRGYPGPTYYGPHIPLTYPDGSFDVTADCIPGVYCPVGSYFLISVTINNCTAVNPPTYNYPPIGPYYYGVTPIAYHDFVVQCDDVPGPPPAVSISARENPVNYNQDSHITWTSQYASHCDGPYPINPNGDLQGTNVDTGPLTATTTYSITCSNSKGQSANASVTVYVNAPATPVPSLTCSAKTLTVTWNSTGAAGYTVQVAKESSRNSDGSFTNPLASDHTASTTLSFTGNYVEPNKTYYAVVKPDGSSTYYPTPVNSVPNSATCPAPPQFTVSGNVYEDTTGDSCLSGNNYKSSPLTLTLQHSDGTGSPVTQDTTIGAFTFSHVPGGITYTLSSTTPPLYSVEKVYGTGVTQNVNDASFTLSSNITDVTFCITKFKAWFQTDHGDIRMNSVNDILPSGQFASDDGAAGINPGIVMSSGSDPTLGNGTASRYGWSVNNEYGSDSFAIHTLGSTSYTFYKSRANQSGIVPVNLNSNGMCSGSLCNINPSIDQKIGEYTGTMTLGTVSLQPNSHFILLVNGDVTITNPIQVNPGQLFILASSGTITVSSLLGQDPTDLTPTLDGYYTAQKDIVIDTKHPDCGAGERDLRINVGGALIANSLYPFAKDPHGGSVIIKRTLCSNNALYPALKVYNRQDFLLQLTDFYKQTSRMFKEVNP